MSAENRPEGGACFSIHLPASEREAGVKLERLQWLQLEVHVHRVAGVVVQENEGRRSGDHTGLIRARRVEDTDVRTARVVEEQVQVVRVVGALAAERLDRRALSFA